MLKGNAVTLSANFASGTAIVTDGNGSTIPNMSFSGTLQVNPAVTTVYVLTVTNQAGFSTTRALNVNVVTFQSLNVTCTVSTVATGNQTKCTAIGTFTDGTSADLSNQASWNSSANTVATVVAGGIVTASGPGIATITATTFQGFIAAAALVVQ